MLPPNASNGPPWGMATICPDLSVPTSLVQVIAGQRLQATDCSSELLLRGSNDFTRARKPQYGCSPSELVVQGSSGRAAPPLRNPLGDGGPKGRGSPALA